MTAEEMVEKYWDLASLSEDGCEHYLVDTNNFKQALIEFAAYHVEQALKFAAEKAHMSVTNYKGTSTYDKVAIDDHTDAIVDKDSILSAYPLDQIK